MAEDGKRISQLNPATEDVKDGQLAVINPTSDKTEKAGFQTMAGATRASFAWQVSTSYAIDDLVLLNGLTVWKSLVGSNQGNVPAENSFWTQEAISPADGITGVQWAAGVFTYNDSKVVNDNTDYFLQVSAPFLSSDIDAEIIAGTWAARVVLVHTHIHASWSAFQGSISSTNWLLGYYTFESAITPAGGQTLGTANVAYGAHVYFVLGASSTDMVIRVSGTSFDDVTGRAASDTEDVDTSGGVLDDYFETEKKWIGQVNITLQSGTGVITDYGWATYYDNTNEEFILNAFEWVGDAGANDTGPNIIVHHHKSTDWTYNAAGAILPTPMIDMQTEYVTEFQFLSGKEFKFKITGLTVTIRGDLSEGIVIGIDITANNAIRSSSIEITKTDQL